MAIEDKERAWQLFHKFNAFYKYSWLYKQFFNAQPHIMRKVGLRAGFGLYTRHRDLVQPVIDVALRSLPGFGQY